MITEIKDSKLSGIAVQNNKLVNAKFDMSIHQVRLFISILARIKRDDVEFSKMQIPVNEIISSTSGSNYKYIREACRGLLGKFLEVERENEDKKKIYRGIPLMSVCEYVQGTGKVEILLNDQIRPYLLQLKENFTSAEIQVLRKLKSYYSFRIYWMLKQFQRIGKRRFTIEDFKAKLNIEEKYNYVSDIRKRIIEPVKKELMEITDISFDYVLIKQGRTYHEIVFTIRANNIDSVNKEIEQEFFITTSWEEKLQILNVSWASIQEIKGLIDSGHTEESYILYCIDRVRDEVTKKKINSLSGLLYKAIIDSYWWQDYVKQVNNEVEKFDQHKAWSQCLSIIKQNIDEEEFELFFLILKMKYYDFHKKELFIVVPSRSHYLAIESDKYFSIFKNAVKNSFHKRTTVSYIVADI